VNEKIESIPSQWSMVPSVCTCVIFSSHLAKARKRLKCAYVSISMLRSQKISTNRTDSKIRVLVRLCVFGICYPVSIPFLNSQHTKWIVCDVEGLSTWRFGKVHRFWKFEVMGSRLDRGTMEPSLPNCELARTPSRFARDRGTSKSSGWSQDYFWTWKIWTQTCH